MDNDEEDVIGWEGMWRTINADLDDLLTTVGPRDKANIVVERGPCLHNSHEQTDSGLNYYYCSCSSIYHSTS